MALDIDAAVAAARAADAGTFAEASAVLLRHDQAQLIAVMGGVLREALERSHADGLDADDAEQVLRSCVAASGWYGSLDPNAVIRALTDALGVTDPETAPSVEEAAVLTHGVLLIADRLRATGQELAPLLDGALHELMRAQTVEFP